MRKIHIELRVSDTFSPQDLLNVLSSSLKSTSGVFDTLPYKFIETVKLTGPRLKSGKLIVTNNAY